MKQLHEKKISELKNACLECEGFGMDTVKETLNDESNHGFGYPAIEYALFREWAMAVVKDCIHKLGDGIEITIDPRINTDYRTSFKHTKFFGKVSSNENYLMSVITFLIDRAEITDKELK